MRYVVEKAKKKKKKKKNKKSPDQIAVVITIQRPFSKRCAVRSLAVVRRTSQQKRYGGPDDKSFHDAGSTSCCVGPASGSKESGPEMETGTGP